MNTLISLTKRNIKLFFKDKGAFFTSLITPMILLVLYVTFLAKVYRDSFQQALPQGFAVPDEVINGLVGSQLLSSLLAVCCVTVAFCSNMLMVSDKVTGARSDLVTTPIKSSTLALGYYLATAACTLTVCLAATGAGFLYLAKVGWYLTAGDVLCILLDEFLLVLFGTALSSVIHFFLSTQGQISAVGAIISAGYGFICGAYMPISQFGEGLQRVIAFLPGTYGTSLLRNHTMRGVFAEMAEIGFPAEVVEAIRDSVDCNLYFFENKVELGEMYAVLIGAAMLLIAAYILINWINRKKV